MTEPVYLVIDTQEKLDLSTIDVPHLNPAIIEWMTRELEYGNVKIWDTATGTYRTLTATADTAKIQTGALPISPAGDPA